MSPFTTTGIVNLGLDGAHRRPVGASLVELAAGAAVHRHQADAGALGALRQLRGVDGAIVPAEPHLERHRNRHRVDGRLDQGQGMIEIAHQRGSGLAAGDVAGRAAHVDVDDRGARGLRDAGSLRHPARFATGELHHVDADPLPLGAQHGLRAGSAPSPGSPSSRRPPSPVPSLAAARRNGASVIPVIGASTARFGSMALPTARQDLRKADEERIICHAHELGDSAGCIEFSQIASVRKCCSAINPRISEFTGRLHGIRLAPTRLQANSMGTERLLECRNSLAAEYLLDREI